MKLKLRILRSKSKLARKNIRTQTENFVNDNRQKETNFVMKIFQKQHPRDVTPGLFSLVKDNEAKNLLRSQGPALIGQEGANP